MYTIHAEKINREINLTCRIGSGEIVVKILVPLRWSPWGSNTTLNKLI